MRNIECYFCGGVAKEKDTPPNSFATTCDNRGRYELTFEAIYFYIKNKDGSDRLCEEQKKELSKFVREN